MPSTNHVVGCLLLLDGVNYAGDQNEVRKKPPPTSPPAKPTKPPPPPLESNPIMQYFEIGVECCTAGPELVWRIHDAYRKSDGKECSVFLFDKRLAEKVYKARRNKDAALDKIKNCIALLEKYRHPKMLQVIHSLEEGINTLAFASEPILACLQNIMAWHDSTPVPPGAPQPVMPSPIVLGDNNATLPVISPRPRHAREYYFLEFEIRYGLLQIIDALHFLHYTARLIHRNLCPHVIVVTKRGTWKLFGLEFIEDVHPKDPIEFRPIAPWNIKYARIIQPNLDYLSPEQQTNGHVSVLSDMFSLGLVICTIFNNGKSIIQANNNPQLYLKQVETLDHKVNMVLQRVPVPLQEVVQRLMSREPTTRPTTQLLPLIKYFKGSSEIAIQAMQFLDLISTKDPNQKTHFYRVTLIEALPFIPPKLRWQHVWPTLKTEITAGEVLVSALHPVIWLTGEASSEEFSTHILPVLKSLLMAPKCTQASVTILENLLVIMKKCDRKEINNGMLPLLFMAIENNNYQIQTSSLIAIKNVSDLIDDKCLQTVVLGKIRTVMEACQADVKVVNLALAFFEKVLVRLERGHIIEILLPSLLGMTFTDPDLITRVVKLYRTMLFDSKFGLTVNVMANKLIPSLAPQTMNPSLNYDQFEYLMTIIYDMLANIDTVQKHKIKMQQINNTEKKGLFHQMSNDNMTAPPFNIPNLRVEQRKTSSAENMTRKNSISNASSVNTGSVSGFRSTGIGQWFFGSSNSTNDNNFLRVASAFPNRRLSDNTLMTPKIRIAPSCASSPGGTPGSTSGLPTRRHSSIGPQERRGSTVNLSPPTGYHQYRGRGGSGSSLSVPSTSHCVLSRSMIGGSMPNTSSSVPFLLTSSMQSIRSRRPSTCMSGSQGSGLIHQLSSGMVRHLPMASMSHAPPAPSTHWSALQGATAAGYSALQNTAMAVRKCPSLNITLTR